MTGLDEADRGSGKRGRTGSRLFGGNRAFSRRAVKAELLSGSGLAGIEAAQAWQQKHLR
jgi:hypothetical protein